MPSTLTARRPFAGLVVAASVAALIAAPASARADDVDPEIWLDSDFGASAIALGAVKDVPVWYRASAVGGAPAPRSVNARIDTSGAKNLTVALTRPTPGCSAAAAVISCQRPAIPPSYEPDGNVQLRLAAARGVKAGDTGTITITVTAESGETSVRTFTVTVTAPGPDLGVTGHLATAKPGGTATARPAIHNSGDRAAKTILVYITTGWFSSLPDRYRNCHYKVDDYGFEHAVCLLENVNLKPRESLTFGAATPLRLAVKPNVPGRYRVNRYDPPGQPNRTYAAYRVDAFDGKPVDERLSWPLGAGPVLTWARTTAPARAVSALVKDTDVDARNNYANLFVTVAPNNPTDMAATGGTIRGRVGEIVSLKIGVANQGPAVVSATPEGKGGDPYDPYNAGFRFTVPSSVEVVEVITPGVSYETWHEETTPAGKAYLVLPFSLNDGARYTVEFRVRIKSAQASKGTIVSQGGVFDPDSSDNTATVSVNPR